MRHKEAIHFGDSARPWEAQLSAAYLQLPQRQRSLCTSIQGVQRGQSRLSTSESVG